MTSAYAEHRDVVEQQLFDVFTRIVRSRDEVDFFRAELGLAVQGVERADERMAESQTPLAQIDCRAARKRVENAERGVNTARRQLEDLEEARDRLLTKLVG